MNLKMYLAKIGMSAKNFSKLIKCNESYLSKVMNGKVKAGYRLAKDIEQATKGEVKEHEIANIQREWPMTYAYNKMIKHHSVNMIITGKMGIFGGWWLNEDDIDHLIKNQLKPNGNYFKNKRLEMKLF